MAKRKVLELLQALFRDAIMRKTDPDDASGAFTVYLVDQEKLMYNIESALERLD